jgi:hypothetical protein
MDINAWLAERILAQCFYPPQQSRLKSGQISILRLVVLLKQNRWLDGSQITFCRLPTGRLILVNVGRFGELQRSDKGRRR